MSAEIVIAAYRPKDGGADALAQLVGRHVPTLQSEGLATERAPIVMRSAADGTIIEVFEWMSGDASRRAHENAAVKELWDAMGEVAEFVSLSSLAEAGGRFPHFEPV